MDPFLSQIWSWILTEKKEEREPFLFNKGCINIFPSIQLDVFKRCTHTSGSKKRIFSWGRIKPRQYYIIMQERCWFYTPFVVAFHTCVLHLWYCILFYLNWPSQARRYYLFVHGYFSYITQRNCGKLHKFCFLIKMGWYKIINFSSRVPQTQFLFLFKTVKKETRDGSRVDSFARCLFYFLSFTKFKPLCYWFW